VGQSQRSKVLKWPNCDGIIGYVGDAEIGNAPTDEWLYAFIGRNLEFSDFAGLAEARGTDLQQAMVIGDLTDRLIVHLGGFELVAGSWTSRMWSMRLLAPGGRPTKRSGW
jgi:hypothetical protein